MSEYAKNLNTGRLIKKSTSLYKKLKKLNQVSEIDEIDEPDVIKTAKPTFDVVKTSEPEPEINEPEFDESKLQTKLADISTDLIQKNMKKIVKAQKLSDKELDLLLKKMLFKKLCIDEPEPKPKKKKKPKKRVVESSSESDSD
jgi:hypothetical protein